YAADVRHPSQKIQDISSSSKNNATSLHDVTSQEKRHLKLAASIDLRIIYGKNR
ncbi:hypothetical protein ACJX0J_028980, partial [Zea mays]